MYGGTYRLFAQVFEPLNIQFSLTDFADIQSIQKAFTASTKMVWIETPTNPLLKIFDIALISEFAHTKNALVVVDNTFATPYFQKPLNLGADIVVHSTTKYINGHSDVIGGAVVLDNEELHDKIKFYQMAIGAVPSPFDSWLILRGIKTLAVRMRQHEINASRVALFLQKHPKVESVFFPGLKTHVNHQVAAKQMTGFGGLVSFNIKGGLEAANKFFKGLKIFSLAESLGGVESLANYSTIMTHGGFPDDLKKKIGITDNLIRLSIGIEYVDDLIKDLDDALNQS